MQVLNKGLMHFFNTY